MFTGIDVFRGYDFVARITLQEASRETVIMIALAFVGLGFNAFQWKEGEGHLIVGCNKKEFEETFKTSLERIPQKGELEDFDFTPEHFKLLEQVIIPEHLKELMKEIVIVEPFVHASENTLLV